MRLFSASVLVDKQAIKSTYGTIIVALFQSMIGLFSKDPEIKLMEKISLIKDSASGWHAVLLNFSGLLQQYKSEYQRKISLNVIMDHIRAANGSVFVCSNGDIIILSSGIGRQLLDKMVFQLRYLYSDDPLAYTIDGVENHDFSSIMDLAEQYEVFYEQCKARLVNMAKKDFARTGEAPSEAESKLKPITPSRLSTIEKEIQAADLSKVMRRQPVVLTKSGAPVKSFFEEYYLNIAHLQRIMGSDVNLSGNRWLFKYLTQLLDYKMLQLIARRPSVYLASPISINLNVDTVLSDRFAEFNSEVRATRKPQILIEINIADMFYSMEQFEKAREILRRMGYKLVLDGVDPKSFIQIDRKHLGFDLVKLHYSTSIEDDIEGEVKQKLAQIVKDSGQSRIIMCRCDNREAVQYGESIGLNLFQGRFLDYLLNPDSKVVN